MYTKHLIYEICFARLASLGSPSPRSSLHDDHPLIFEDRYTDNNLRDSWCALGRLPLARVSIPAGFDESNPCLMILREILDILATVKLALLLIDQHANMVLDIAVDSAEKSSTSHLTANTETALNSKAPQRRISRFPWQPPSPAPRHEVLDVLRQVATYEPHPDSL